MMQDKIKALIEEWEKRRARVHILLAAYEKVGREFKQTDTFQFNREQHDRVGRYLSESVAVEMILMDLRKLISREGEVA